MTPVAAQGEDRKKCTRATFKDRSDRKEHEPWNNAILPTRITDGHIVTVEPSKQAPFAKIGKVVRFFINTAF